MLKKLFLSLIFVLNISVFADSLDPIDLLSEFVSIDTINPPGNESRAVDFYAKIFEREGIEYFTGESAPGRGNIWARIKGGDLPLQKPQDDFLSSSLLHINRQPPHLRLQ